MEFYDYPCCEICGINTLYTCAGCYTVLDNVNREHHCPEKSDKVEYPVLCGICDSDLNFPTKVQLRNKRKLKANLEWNGTYDILLRTHLEVLRQKQQNSVDESTISQTAAQAASRAADTLCQLPRFKRAVSITKTTHSNGKGNS